MNATPPSVESVMTSQWFIGLDVGRTKIAGGLVDTTTGTILVRRKIPTIARWGGGAVLRDVVGLTDSLTSKARARGGTVQGIGIGVAELVDPNGHIRSAHSIDWTSISPEASLAHIAPVVVESDVRAAALGEARFGAGQPYSIFTYVTVGTGISSCLVQDGRPFAGSRGNALVLASAPISSTCVHCGAGQEQVLESVASGPALVARYNSRVNRTIVDGHEVMAAVAQGDEVAKDVVRSAGAALGNSVGWLVNVLDPEAVVVGGGLGLAGGLFWDSFVASTRAHVWSELTRELPIVTAGLGADSGIIGAALAACGNPGATQRQTLAACVTSTERGEEHAGHNS